MPTVLVVDDSGIDRRLAAGLLSKGENIVIQEAKDGAEALIQLELHLPDIVVTDLQMPNLTGLELVTAIRRDYPLIPVILMTSQGSEEIAVEALRCGASSYVPKRNMAQELLSTVEQVLLAAQENRSNTRLMKRMVSCSYQFILENDMSLVASLSAFLRQSLATSLLCDETDRLRLGIAIEEALLNALYHGNLEVSSELRELDYDQYYNLARQRCHEDPYQKRRLFIRSSLSDERGEWEIRDEGPGFCPADLADPTDTPYLDRPSGRGLLLMRTFMDEVRFNDKGNVVLMVKNRAKSAEEPAA